MGAYDAIINRNVVTIYQGSTYRDTVTVEQTAGVPLNLTGYTVQSKIKLVSTGDTVNFTCSVPTPSSGVVQRSLSNALTVSLTPCVAGKYVWALQLTAPSGDVLPEIQGGAIVIAEVISA